MEKLLFERNVQSPGLSEKINNALEKLKGIREWKMDFDSIQNLLIIEGIRLDPIEIISKLSLHGIEVCRLYEE